MLLRCLSFRLVLSWRPRQTQLQTTRLPQPGLPLQLLRLVQLAAHHHWQKIRSLSHPLAYSWTQLTEMLPQPQLAAQPLQLQL